MSHWLHNLPVPWMALAIFAFTYLLAVTVFAAVTTLAAGGRAKSFRRFPLARPASTIRRLSKHSRD
jgi:hypothetical protein